MSSLKLCWEGKCARALCWSFGDARAVAGEVAALAMGGKKRGACSSLVRYQKEQRLVTPG
ncbi:hypothetical protein ASO17_26605 [Salmonella enterica subsp. enterica serovar Infantis]|nr:hypothetical protein ASO17_26605 [Salmonella enterica subsp. enterica serovar Infantis]